MIRVTRVNNQPLAVNSDLIKFVEQTHDTVLTLINGDKIVVRESLEEVIQRTLEFRRSILVDVTATYPATAATASSQTSNEKQQSDPKVRPE
jgi:flagellar protein FlbD